MSFSIDRVEVKPKLRGMFHRGGFFFYLFIGFIVLFLIPKWKTRFIFFIYVFSILILYGASSFYHTTNFKTKKNEKIARKIDHASIYLMIAGTYTPVCFFLFPNNFFMSKNLLLLVWCISFIGITKEFLFKNTSRWFNVLIYLFNGLLIIPFFSLIRKEFDDIQFLCIFLGGVFYVIGSFFYGFKWPNISKNLGYHEVFHLFTLIANSFFFILITKSVLF